MIIRGNFFPAATVLLLCCFGSQRCSNHMVSAFGIARSSSAKKVMVRMPTTRWLEDNTRTTTACHATVAPPEATTRSVSLHDQVLQQMSQLRPSSLQFAEQYELSTAEASFYALFAAIRQVPVPLGLHGNPFVLRHEEIVQALQLAETTTQWPGFFTMSDLQKAVTDDFLDALRGSTDHSKGWKITDVSQPRGDSFEQARMTFDDVQAALDKGTVIFNAAGAHIPKLAGPTLACTEATLLPCALNMYVTAAGKRTSAPPHTDKQDVVVVQTSGRKHWRVYSPPDPALKPSVDMFARGKGDDRLPLYALESEWGCRLLLETTLNPGDVLFVPAAFPHTTSTVVAGSDDNDTDTDNMDPVATAHANADTSIHLTFNLDHHIWELDYLNARRLALRLAGVVDTALGPLRDDDSPYCGKANELPDVVRKDLFAELPLGLLEPDAAVAAPWIESVTAQLEKISRAVDEPTASAVDPAIWKQTVERLRQEGVDLFEIHRDMYIAAIQEGRLRDAEDAMTAHLHAQSPSSSSQQPLRRVMSPERIQRLSLFRVKRFYDQINEAKNALTWLGASSPAAAGGPSATATTAAPAAAASTALPENWAFTLPVTVGAAVEADLGGAFFPAKVTRASGGTYDVEFFDGDKEFGLDRSQIRLTSPPAAVKATDDEDVDVSKMTPKQLKRWKKQQEKLNNNNNKSLQR